MFSTILTNFIARLATVVALRPQVVMKPLPGPVPYDGKTGVHCFVGSPQPVPTSGAGRWGYKVTRTISVLCVTESLNDPGGRSEAAAAKHLAFEDSVIDVGLDFNVAPKDLGGGMFMCRWVPGGDEMMRFVKLNPGLNGSVLVFEVSYSQTLTT